MQSTKRIGLLGGVGALLLSAAVLAGQGAQIVREAPLLDAPVASASVNGTLAKKTAVTVLERQGGWYRVRAPAGNEGWVKLLSVRLEANVAALDEGGASGSPDVVGAAASGASGGGATAAATGALGSMLTGQSTASTAATGASSGTLSGRTLVNEQGAGGGAALQEIETFRSSEDEMKAFMEEGGLGEGQATPAEPER